jgi:hypothetical protein
MSDSDDLRLQEEVDEDGNDNLPVLVSDVRKEPI